MDALMGRDKHGSLSVVNKTRFIRWAFYFQTNEYEEWAFSLATLLFSICAYLEANTVGLALGLTAPCIVLFCLDIVAKIHYMTPRDCLANPWNVIQVPYFLVRKPLGRPRVSGRSILFLMCKSVFI
jgi:hypothetical protein